MYKDLYAPREISQALRNTSSVEPETVLDIGQALKDMKDRQRQAIILYAMGYSPDAISEKLHAGALMFDRAVKLLTRILNGGELCRR